MSVAHQVGHEDQRALEDADHDQIAIGVVGADLGAELGHAAVQPLRIDQGLADPPVPAAPRWIAHRRRVYSGATGHGARGDHGDLGRFLEQPELVADGDAGDPGDPARRR